MSEEGLAAWLGGLDTGLLAAVLERRPDAVLGHRPVTLGRLAERLAHPASLFAALRGLTTPALQALEALCALGERRTRAALVELLAGGPGPEHERAVDEILAELTSAALVWPGKGDRLEVAGALRDVLPDTLSLGRPAREVWSEQNADAIGRAVRALGGRPEGRKADKLEALLRLLADPELVRRRAAHAPSTVAEGLQRMARPRAEDDEYFDRYDDRYHDEYFEDRFDPGSYRREDAEVWGIAAGLLAGRSWGFGATMPAEVALALRGPEYRAPFAPRPPALSLRPVAVDVVDSAAGAAITQFLAKTVALLERLARAPVPLLAGGGIGVRELRRLVGESGTDEAEVRLVLGLAAAAELLLPNVEGLTVGERFARWRDEEPATQAAALLTAWWDFPDVPSRSRDADGKGLPVLRGGPPCGECQAGRFVLLAAAASLPPGVGADTGDLARAARWNRPLVHVLPEDADAPLATVYREAELLGALAAGALTPLGAALLTEDPDALHRHLDRLLPEPTDTALFGSDLTVMVAGAPSAYVTSVLDSCADRESGGGAITWRFSPASVRRAFDAGTSAEALTEQLTGLAGKPLPQPLTYLIGDVARRHGRLRLLPAVALIRSDDEALLAEVAADRRLAGLGLQAIAPTVLACGVPLDQALARLRDCGYFPVADPADPAAPVAAPTSRRQKGADAPSPARPPRSVPRPEPMAGRRLLGMPEPEAGPPVGELARELLEAGDLTVPAAISPVAGELARQAPQLTSAELDWLAGAIERGGRVRIEYLASSGAVTQRVISDPELLGGMVYAWCELRQDERTFSVGGIRSVSPAG